MATAHPSIDDLEPTEYPKVGTEAGAVLRENGTVKGCHLRKSLGAQDGCDAAFVRPQMCRRSVGRECPAQDVS